MPVAEKDVQTTAKRRTGIETSPGRRETDPREHGIRRGSVEHDHAAGSSYRIHQDLPLVQRSVSVVGDEYP